MIWDQSQHFKERLRQPVGAQTAACFSRTSNGSFIASESLTDTNSLLIRSRSPCVYRCLFKFNHKSCSSRCTVLVKVQDLNIPVSLLTNMVGQYSIIFILIDLFLTVTLNMSRYRKYIILYIYINALTYLHTYFCSLLFFFFIQIF